MGLKHLVVVIGGGSAESFRRTLVGLKPYLVTEPREPDRSFRRTLVGLKRE
ncbi:hypothetical protein HAH_4160 [Haloarcula hispanica ATCC 33960]|uniref:Uncharacterized protein n=1 Tax=Haloarcula hispanica (strain ATCC 33960 / DSM 4426 / JCM 8911 / NBRC 102182 / NCIMB 2187 / VKM B-1755) TaxID=634497 RepID=G0HZP0_HALHT|nr:hypothetical protein HAH_4160 [Haloarcula hispanica ATCC 33960]